MLGICLVLNGSGYIYYRSLNVLVYVKANFVGGSILMVVVVAFAGFVLDGIYCVLVSDVVV